MLRRVSYVLLLVAGVMLAAVPPLLAADPPAKAEAAGPPPKPLVIKFKNIPAASFVETLRELGRSNKQLGEGLAKMPISVNEASNAVVIIAPPEVAEMLASIAKNLDTPNDFRAAQREMAAKDAEQRLKIDEERKKAGLPVEPTPAARPPAPNRGMMQQGAEGRGPVTVQRGYSGILTVPGGPGMMQPPGQASRHGVATRWAT